MRFSTLTSWLAASSSLMPGVAAVNLNVSDPNSIQGAALTVASNMLTFYNGTKPGYAPGILTNPYYWWEAGAMFGVLIHFWHLTGNAAYNKIVTDGLLWQKGDGNNFEPVNQTKDLGNDDQSFWAYAALDAAEYGFPNPPAGNPSWLSLAQAVFNRQIARWDPTTCGGGIRWQIYQFNPGWTYKNTAANGGLFHIAARLARYTGNATYATNADKIWDWMVGINFIQEYNIGNTSNINGVRHGYQILNSNGSATNITERWNSTGYKVIDGAPTADNCTGPNVDGLRWTYNHGTVLMGAAYMYNYTNGSDIWRQRLQLLVTGAADFFVGAVDKDADDQFPSLAGYVMTEAACEEPTPQTCKIDQPAFKGMFVRWLAVTTQFAPWTADTIYPWLNGTAQHAATQCVGNHGTTSIQNPQSGGSQGSWCGRRWYSNYFDGYSGLGEQMASMSAMQNALVLFHNTTAPVTSSDGGSSESVPDAGNEPTHPTILSYIYDKPLGRGDTAGAWILTAFGMIIIGAGAIWMVREEPAEAWGGAGPQADWMAPSAGAADYYRKTYGYGAYRLAGLKAGGVYAGKNSLARNMFVKPKGPAQGLGAGGWWFGSGRGLGERWWDRAGDEHAEELAEKYPNGFSTASLHKPRDSVTSDDSRKGLFARVKKSNGSDSKMKNPKGAPAGKPGEWKSIGRGVFVRAREVDDNNSESAIQRPAASRSSTMNPQRQSMAQNRRDSATQSRVQSTVVRGRSSRSESRGRRASSAQPSRSRSKVTSRATSRSTGRSRARDSTRENSPEPQPTRGKVLHWPAAAPEPEFNSDEE